MLSICTSRLEKATSTTCICCVITQIGEAIGVDLALLCRFARVTLIATTVNIGLIGVEYAVEAEIGHSVVGAHTIVQAVVGARIKRNNGGRRALCQSLCDSTSA